MLKSYLPVKLRLSSKLRKSSLEFLVALLHLGYKAGIVLFLEQFLVGQQIVILLFEIQHQGLGVFQPGQLGGHFLGGLGIFPEVGLGGLFLEALYVPLDLSGVKDDPSLR